MPRREPCHRCGAAPGAAPLTPVTFWAGRLVRAALCAPCLHAAAGSLLYRVDRERLDALGDARKAAWLASLHPDDRGAYAAT